MLQGDSGGPLMVQENGQYILIGVASLSDNDTPHQNLQFFERTSAHRDWIDSQITYPEFCPSGPNAGVTKEEYMAEQDEKNTREEYLVEKRAKYVWIGIFVALAVVLSVLGMLLFNRKSKSKGYSRKTLDETSITGAITKL